MYSCNYRIVSPQDTFDGRVNNNNNNGAACHAYNERLASQYARYLRKLLQQDDWMIHTLRFVALQTPRNFQSTLPPQRRSSMAVQPSGQRNSVDSSYTPSDEKRSLDFTQRIEKTLAEYNASNNILKRWLLELLSWTISALCISTIIVIYLRINGSLMSKSEHALNSANILGKIASAMLIVPTSEASGQLKWHWFHNSKAIWDFEIFDKATRGPWGAALLLYRTKGRSLAALGALLIVLLLAIDTFFQQVVVYPDGSAEEKNLTAQIPKVVTYTPTYHPAFQGGYEISSEDQRLAVAMRSYFFDNGTQPVLFGNGTRPEIPLSCPTSSCSWPSYDTLAVCSSCQEVSHLLDLSYSCMNTSIDWSTQWISNYTAEPTALVCGTFLNATSENPILLTGNIMGHVGNLSNETLLVRTVPLTDFATKLPLYGHGSLSFKDVRYPLLDALIASETNRKEGEHSQNQPLVHECMLSWCVQTLRSTYEYGKYTEVVESIHVQSPKHEDPWPWYTFETEAGTFVVYSQNYTIDQFGTEIGSPATSAELNVNNATMANVMNIFDDIFPAFYTQSATGDRLLRFKNYPGYAPILRAMEFNPWLAPNNISRHMERLAESMTNVLRSSDSKIMVEGKAYSIKTFISVKWEWLTFPIALLLLSLAFLVSTIVKTSKDTETGVWKTSSMPTLIYSLPEDARGKFTAQNEWASSHGDTKKVRIKLLPKLGWRVSGQDLLRSPVFRRNQPPPGWI